MSINFEQLRLILNGLSIPVYRDEPPSNISYPFIIYEFVNEQHKRASNDVILNMPLYQISFVTQGIEIELDTLRNILIERKVAFQSFESIPFDENDESITQFYTYVRCING